MKTVLKYIVLVFATGALAQDPQFSQFYSNALYLAPSFAGLMSDNRFSASYRNQWPEIGNGYTTFSGSFEHFFSKFNSGLGVQFMTDRAGTGNLRSFSAMLHYAYDFRLIDDWHVRPGLSFGYVERAIDFNRLLWRDQMSATGTDPYTAEVPAFDKVGDIDFGTSIIAYSQVFWFGTTVDHLLRPNQSLYDFERAETNQARVPMKYSLFGGAKVTAKESLLRPVPTSLQIAFYYRQQAHYSQLDLGLYWYRSPLVIGLWYRGIPVLRDNAYNDALIMLIGYRTRQFNIGYSYDFTLSKLVMATGGSHEITLAYTFRYSIPKKRMHMVPCPEF